LGGFISGENHSSLFSDDGGVLIGLNNDGVGNEGSESIDVYS